MVSLSTRFFTLIELLIVISIFLILFSMLQPSLQKISSDARAMQCISQEARVFSYMSAYLDDNGGLYAPATRTSTGQWWDQITYDDALSVYDGRDMEERTSVTQYSPDKAVGNEEIYRCTEEQLTGWGNQLRRSYALNTELVNRWVGPTRFSFTVQDKSVYDIPSPAQVILLTEVRSEPGHYAATQNVMSGGQNGYYAFLSGPGAQSYGQYSIRDVWAEPWHDSEWNYTFADGHVEKLAPIETVNLTDIKDRFGDGYWTKALND